MNTEEVIDDVCPTICLGLDGVRELDALQRGEEWCAVCEMWHGAEPRACEA